MKVVITITKQEIEQAIERFVDDRVRAGYSNEFTKKQISFRNTDGDIGYFESDIEVEVKEPGKDEAKE